MPDPRDFLPPPPWEGPPVPRGGLWHRRVLVDAKEYLGRIYSDASYLIKQLDKLKVDCRDIAESTVYLKRIIESNPSVAFDRIAEELIPSLESVSGAVSYTEDILGEMIKDAREILARGI